MTKTETPETDALIANQPSEWDNLRDAAWSFNGLLDHARSLERRLRAAESAQALPYQRRVYEFMLACFGAEIAQDRRERNHRFLEESLELVQSLGCTAADAHMLVDYTFGRPVGHSHQETGGVMVTLAALCCANLLDMEVAGEDELKRVWGKMEAIREKQKNKPRNSPLAESAQAPVAGEVAESDAAWLRDRSIMFDPQQRAYAEEVAGRIESLSAQVEALKNTNSAALDAAEQRADRLQSQVYEAQGEIVNLQSHLLELGADSHMAVYGFDIRDGKDEEEPNSIEDAIAAIREEQARGRKASAEAGRLQADLDAAKVDAERWKRLYECAQNANAFRQDALDGQ